MTYQTQHNALRTKFLQEWGTTTPIAWPNAPFQPPTDAPWVRFVVADGTSDQKSFGAPGSNVFRYPGVVTIMIFTLLGKGDKDALLLADQACAVFRNWEGSGIRFLQPPYVRQVPGADDKWYHVNVICPFERDSLE